METTEQRLPLTTAVSQLRLDTRASATDYKIAASAPQCRRSQSRAHLPRDAKETAHLLMSKLKAQQQTSLPNLRSNQELIAGH